MSEQTPRVRQTPEREVSAREELVAGLAEHACCFTEEDAEKLVDAFAHELAEQQRQRSERLAKLLRDMDETQRETDEDGGREVAWYYYRDQIEDALGLGRGALDTGERQSLADILASVREQVEEQGGTWPPKPPPGFPLPHLGGEAK